MSGPRPRTPRREVDGVLLLDKPTGLTSNAALQRAKRLYQAEKAGHTGTLDPLASGLLPICFGEATKFAQALLDSDKTYEATIRFGIATSTGDAEGDVIGEGPAYFARDEFEAVLPRFLGVVSQVPPRHAALKFEGRAYYDYARAGIEIVRRPREVRIDAIEILDFSPPTVTVRVACGKGTYIRVLAGDLGSALSSCAHLTALRRIATGPFAIAGTVALDALEAMDIVCRDALLLPAHSPLGALPSIVIEAADARALFQGRVARAAAGIPGRYRGFDAGGCFLGLVEINENGIRAVRLTRTLPNSTV